MMMTSVSDKPLKGQGGYTLIELMIGLAIVAILLAVSGVFFARGCNSYCDSPMGYNDRRCTGYYDHGHRGQ